ncbi:hypothetical protein COV94_05170 [Candidatus Woesearchaeota archaeon CG11_big_fil_rev_8_21_14_0_20_57_5]|nr:MAG: hypothetical protein COV94_05170 [Candidatus Woesearchaeota archaeon CG11_big_fil_rev_8_21_14_0_20_57_5]
MLLIALSTVTLLVVPAVSAGPNCAVYFTGCKDCVQADKIIQDLTDTVVIVYDVNAATQNENVRTDFRFKYTIGYGMPVLVLGPGDFIAGNKGIEDLAASKVAALQDNPCPLVDERPVFGSLRITMLPGVPQVWAHDRVLLYDGGEGDDGQLRAVLTGSLPAALLGVSTARVDPRPVVMSNITRDFANAVKIDGWKLEWDGDALPGSPALQDSGDTTDAAGSADPTATDNAGTIPPGKGSAGLIAGIIVLVLVVVAGFMVLQMKKGKE